MLKTVGRYSLTPGHGGKKTITANIPMSPGGVSGGSTSSMQGVGFGSNYRFGILEGIVESTDDKSLRAIFRDIYLHDSIAGAAVDITSSLPFDDYSLTQLPSAEMAHTFMHALDKLKLQSLMPRISVDYHVMGQFIGVLNFDATNNTYTSLVPQSSEFCEITPVPVHGEDPIVKVQFSSDQGKALKQRPELVNRIGKELYAAICGGKSMVIQPQNLLYVPRTMMSSDSMGTSYFRRILPFYFYEKALLRGTIALAHRRQRAILHVQAGDEDWIPTEDELQALTQLFSMADIDPIGAVVATRNNLNVGEIRTGGDFWKWDELYDSISTAKMRALGINEAILSGDASYNSLEASLSIFMDQLRAFREEMTRKVYYEKVLPQISVVNDFKIDNRITVTGNFGTRKAKEPSPKQYRMKETDGKWSVGTNKTHHVKAASIGVDVNLEDYYIPTVHWHKPLKPEADRDYMEILQSLTEAGLPIPLRMLAAAGGQNVDEILLSMKDDLATRKEFQKYSKAIKDLDGGSEDDTGGDGGETDISDADFDAVTASTPIVGLANRKFKPVNNLREKNGKMVPTSAAESRRIDEKVNRQIATAMKNLANK